MHHTRLLGPAAVRRSHRAQRVPRLDTSIDRTGVIVALRKSTVIFLFFYGAIREH